MKTKQQKIRQRFILVAGIASFVTWGCGIKWLAKHPPSPGELSAFQYQILQDDVWALKAQQCPSQGYLEVERAKTVLDQCLKSIRAGAKSDRLIQDAEFLANSGNPLDLDRLNALIQRAPELETSDAIAEMQARLDANSPTLLVTKRIMVWWGAIAFIPYVWFRFISWLSKPLEQEETKDSGETKNA